MRPRVYNALNVQESSWLHCWHGYVPLHLTFRLRRRTSVYITPTRGTRVPLTPVTCPSDTAALPAPLSLHGRSRRRMLSISVRLCPCVRAGTWHIRRYFHLRSSPKNIMPLWSVIEIHSKNSGYARVGVVYTGRSVPTCRRSEKCSGTSGYFGKA